MFEDVLRILVVDDSALYRQMLRNVLRDIPNVEVVGVAKTGQEALELTVELKPHLLTLDVQMPAMDGIEVLRQLKKLRSRTKAIMVSSLTATGAKTTTDALFEGAFDFILKPSGADANANRKLLYDALAEKIMTFRDGHVGEGSGIIHLSQLLPPKVSFTKLTPQAEEEAEAADPPAIGYEAVLIGTSTGGPVALREVIPALPADLPVPVLVTQHMPAHYTSSLAERLNEISKLRVAEAVDGMLVEAGRVYIAPGGRHMKVTLKTGRPVIRITDDPPEHGCRPSVDYLFRSAVEAFGGKVIAVILTGMGRDGVEGCRQLKRHGAFVIAQHPDGCVVYGMPKAVAEEKLADRIFTLERVATAVAQRIRKSRSAN